MAARGLLAPTGLLWLCLAPAALLRLHQPQPVLTVENGDAVEIVCEASEAMEHEANVFWYQRDGRDGPKLLLDCESRNKSRFSCEFKRHSASATLHIDHARPNDTGLYLCAYHTGLDLHFGNGTTLLVGGRMATLAGSGTPMSPPCPSSPAVTRTLYSWMGRSWVMVLAPRGAPQGPPGPVCAVGDTAGPVLVSWPGGPGRVLGLRGSTGPLISPMGTDTGTRGLCQVRFNASGPPIQRSVELFRAAGHQPGTTEPPVPREDEEELQYAQLRFAAPARRTP
ncbi:uncharacterized protein LOC129197506 [Grus americana]|uniref:uncharacterized protein LOC129197506 n=1 Tax=Grus americana TaxID=9117 RepID=UPI0024080CC4|nr:uncharacterized protein LOC129197506 [Grus americana]